MKRTDLQTAIDEYEDALIRGLCRDGAIEAALRAVPGVTRDRLLREIERAARSVAASPTIRIKRVYDEASPADGVRVLVDRLWPRGVSKQAARIDAWLKEIAPSDALRRELHRDSERWDEFVRRYHAELKSQPHRIAELLALARGGTLTLVYAAKDTKHNNAEALRRFLVARTTG